MDRNILRRVIFAVWSGLSIVMASLILGGLFRGGRSPFLPAAQKEREALISGMLPGTQFTLFPAQLWDRALGRRYFPEVTAYRSGSGQYLFTSGPQKPELALRHTEELYRYCGESGRDFLYVILPGKPEYDEDLTDLGLPCYRNRTADGMREVLEERGIPCLDLRESFRGPDFYSYFYRTEHHWTADGGLKAAREILTALRGRYGTGYPVERLSEEKIGREVVPDCFNGEFGKKTFGAVGPREDLIIRRPLYETHLSLNDPGHGINRSGGFELLTNESLLSSGHPERLNLYYYYLFGLSAVQEIRNEDVDTGDLFVIRESFSNVMLPFLALGANHVTAWDMRGDSRVYDYLEAHPEIRTVVIAYTIASMPNSTLNNFH